MALVTLHARRALAARGIIGKHISTRRWRKRKKKKIAPRGVAASSQRSARNQRSGGVRNHRQQRHQSGGSGDIMAASARGGNKAAASIPVPYAVCLAARRDSINQRSEIGENRRHQQARRRYGASRQAAPAWRRHNDSSIGAAHAHSMRRIKAA